MRWSPPALWSLLVGLALPRADVAAAPNRAAKPDPPLANVRCPWKDGTWPGENEGKLLGPRDNQDPNPPKRLPVDLVIVGKADRPRADGQDGCTVGIERILFGSPPPRPLALGWCEDRPAIMRWAPRSSPDGYDLEWHYEDLTQETAERAHLGALLDCEVLASTRIFVAQEVKTEGRRMHTVKVVRSLHGPALRVGQRVNIRMLHGDYGPPDTQSVPSRQRWIFLSSEAIDGNEMAPELRRPGSVFIVERRLSTAMEPAIRAALNRRSRYPVTLDKGGLPETKIIFLGSTDETIRLLGSSLPEAVALAANTLLVKQDSAKGQVARAIEHEMARSKSANADQDFERLRNLIRLLGNWKEGTVDGLAGNLLRKLMAQIPALPQGPASPPSGVSAKTEAKRSTSNHALTWLLMTMSEQERLKLATELGRVRERVRGHWRAEIDLAFAATRLETAVALAASKGQAATVRKLSASPPCGQKIEAVAFAPDGKSLLTVGRDGQACTWDLASLQPTKTIDLPRDCRLLSIRPDGRYLLCFDGAMWRERERSSRYDARDIRVSVVDLRDGRVVSRLDLPLDDRGARTRWLDERQALLANRKQILRFDYVAGRASPPRQIDAPGVIDEDGKSIYEILLRGKHTGWPELHVVDTSTGLARRLEASTVAADTDSLSGLVPSTPYLYLTSPMLKLLDRRTLAPVIAWETDGEVESVAFSADGSLCALATDPCPRREGLWLRSDEQQALACPPRTQLSVHETASGKRRTVLQVPRGWAKEMVVSPRRDRVVLRSDDGVVRLWQLPP